MQDETQKAIAGGIDLVGQQRDVASVFFFNSYQVRFKGLDASKTRLKKR